ncbi:hypothetical protein [Burkholderia ubonensis]|uniref:hypothetical protein n=1 Tax=Burkholderia ubonensis TaxID=101571 RepID=UPI000AF81E6B|nr:hypothetical protein [Burkholderia ubonensis]
MESAYLETAFIILLPLIPAACIYWLLTPKAKNASNESITNENHNAATGEVKTNLGPTILGIKFNVVGSTAFYLVLLLITFGVHASTVIQNRINGSTAWLVEIPVGALIRDPNDSQKQTPIPIDASIQSQLQVSTQPSYLMFGDVIQFWVIPSNNRFPKVTISLPNMSSTPPLDLNDTRQVTRDDTIHKIELIGKQWLQIQRPYDPIQANKAQSIH